MRAWIIALAFVAPCRLVDSSRTAVRGDPPENALTKMEGQVTPTHAPVVLPTLLSPVSIQVTGTPTALSAAQVAETASIVEYRLKNCLYLWASSMSLLGFQRVTHRIDIPREHASYIHFTLWNENNRRQGNVHRPCAGYLCFLCSCAPMATTITQIHFETGRGGTSRSYRP